MTDGVTPRQADARAFILSFMEANRHAPSFAQIGAALSLKSRSSVKRLVDGLEQRGVVRVRRDINGNAFKRSIEVITPPKVCSHCGRPVDA